MFHNRNPLTDLIIAVIAIIVLTVICLSAFDVKKAMIRARTNSVRRLKELGLDDDERILN